MRQIHNSRFGEAETLKMNTVQLIDFADALIGFDGTYDETLKMIASCNGVSETAFIGDRYFSSHINDQYVTLINKFGTDLKIFALEHANQLKNLPPIE